MLSVARKAICELNSCTHARFSFLYLKSSACWMISSFVSNHFRQLCEMTRNLWNGEKKHEDHEKLASSQGHKYLIKEISQGFLSYWHCLVHLLLGRVGLIGLRCFIFFKITVEFDPLAFLVEMHDMSVDNYLVWALLTLPYLVTTRNIKRVSILLAVSFTAVCWRLAFIFMLG